MGKEQCEAPSCEALGYKFLKVHEEGAVVRLHIDRPHQMNTLSVDTLKELVQFFTGMLYRGDVKVVMVTSAGDKVFVAGADIRELDGFDRDDARWFCDLGHSLFNTMERVPQVILAVIDGYCMGGGFDFAMACDLRVASESAVIAHTACRMGIITGFGGTQRLKRLVGLRGAKELFFTAKRLSSWEALDMGLVHRVYPDGELHQRARELAESIANRGWEELSTLKALLNRALDMDRRAYMLYETYTTLARC